MWPLDYGRVAPALRLGRFNEPKTAINGSNFMLVTNTSDSNLGKHFVLATLPTRLGNDEILPYFKFVNVNVRCLYVGNFKGKR